MNKPTSAEGRVPRLGLGTVQWGTVYGIANSGTRTTAAEVGRILTSARKAGVRLLDTAALYGSAEEVLGSQDIGGFEVVTKTPRLIGSPSQVADQVARSVEQSLGRLASAQLYGVLIHNADDLQGANGPAIVQALQKLKSDRLVRKIGVSIYDASQVRMAMELFTPDLVQVPLNVLDQRLLWDGTLSLLRTQGVEVHARSMFLQGLLLMPLDAVPSYFDPIRPLLKHWHDNCRREGLSPLQAAMSFVREVAEVNCCLVGVESLSQFEQCVNDFLVSRALDCTSFACNDPAFVNPANWRRL